MYKRQDGEALKEALRTLFRNDETSARPAGSMEVVKLIWWKHNCASGQYSSAKVHRTLRVSCDEEGNVSVNTEAVSYTHLDVYKRQVVYCYLTL